MTTGLRPYYDSLRAAGLIDCHIAPRSGSVRCLVGSKSVVPSSTSAILQRNGAFNAELSAWTMDALTFQGCTEGALLIKTTPHLLGTNIRYIYREYNSTGDGGISFAVSASGILIGAVVVGASTGITATAGGGADTITSGKQRWCGMTWKNGGSLQMYVDGVASGAAIALSNVFKPVTAIQAQFSKRPGSTGYLSQTLVDAIFCKFQPTQAQIQTLQAELDDTVYETNNLIINSTYPTIGSSVWEARYGLLAGEQTMSAGQDIGQLASLKVSTGTHKATTILYGSTLAKAIQCVTAGNIILPDPRPDLGTTWAYQYYTAATATWAAVTSATATVTLAAAGDRILWATADGRNSLRKY